MIGPIIEGAFPILWEVEGKPTCDIWQIPVVNKANLDIHLVGDRPIRVQETVPLLLSISGGNTKIDDPIKGTGTLFYLQEKDLFGPLLEAHMIFYNNQMYHAAPGGICLQWGLYEFRAQRTS